jgi:hypothetical protein
MQSAGAWRHPRAPGRRPPPPCLPPPTHHELSPPALEERGELLGHERTPVCAALGTPGLLPGGLLLALLVAIRGGRACLLAVELLILVRHPVIRLLLTGGGAFALSGRRRCQAAVGAGRA